VNRDEYAAQLRAKLDEDSHVNDPRTVLTRAEADAVARLLDELAGIYRGEELGELAGELSQLLDRRIDANRTSGGS
jgi:hypothetical protein